MGMDSARSLDKWKQGLQLTDYINLWIFDRNKALNQSKRDIATLADELPSALQPQVISSVIELTSINKRSSTNPLKSKSQGRIYIDIRSVVTVSSTEIREQFAKYDDKPSLAAKYADTQPNNLMQWLNPSVYQYIITHQLYSAL